MLVALALFSSTALATNVVVPTQQPTVVDAVATLVGPGPHTVQILDEGIYDGHIDIGVLDLTIVGNAAGPATLTNDAGTGGSVLAVDGGRLVLQNIIVSGSIDPAGCQPAGSHRGIAAIDAIVEIIDSTVECFWADEGSGIHAVDSSLQFSMVQFFANAATGAGGAVYASGADFTAEQVTVVDNEAWMGGGFYLMGGTSVDLGVGTYCGNRADMGGAVHVDDPDQLVVMNNVFDGNRAEQGGAGLSIYGDQLGYSILNNTFSSNQAGVDDYGVVTALGSGGAARIEGTVVDFRNNVVAHQMAGGGVLGVEGPAFLVGDPTSFGYNLWFGNCDAPGCDPLTASVELTGALAGVTLDASNVVGADPMMAYAGAGDFDCTNASLWPVWGSPAVDRGDDTSPAYADIDGTRNDIGYTGGPRSSALDRDGDGINNLLDCDDLDPWTNPAAVETCDMLDNDCDGAVDEDFSLLWYIDGDGDGFGSNNPADFVLVQCAPPAGYVQWQGDCDDDDAAINPGAYEICDGVDNDCNLTVDDEGLLPYQTYYRDSDGDNYGLDSSSQYLCVDPGPGWSLTPGDCNDAEVTQNPGAVEICDNLDNDCDFDVDGGAVDGVVWYSDGDGDGFGVGDAYISCAPPTGGATVGGDCDDGNDRVNPVADEVCDGIDNDCNGEADDDAIDSQLWYLDRDGDGFVDLLTEVRACDAPDDMVGLPKGDDRPYDCDDTNELEGPCKGGCGCSTGSAPGAALGWLALGLLLITRRGARS